MGYILEIGRLRLEPGDSESYDFSFSPTETDDGFSLLAPVRVVGSMTFGGNEFLLAGRLAADTRIACSRCLAPVDREIAFDFDEEFDEADFPGEDATIDLADIAYQMLVTAIPMQSLCREDCMGLCPVCGKDLNEGACACPTESIDPRLEALRELLDNKPEAK